MNGEERIWAVTAGHNNESDIKTDTFPVSIHYENVPIQTYWKFYHQKMKIFR